MYTPFSVTDTSMQCYITVQSATGTWKVKAVNGSAQSSLHTFTVSSANAQLTGLSISGPAAIPENGNGQFVATAYFSDGASSTVTSSTIWSDDSGVTSISSGLLSAGGVSSDTPVTVFASYTFGGVTITTSANVTVVNSGSGGGTTTIHPLVNGNFESGVSPWAPSGYADIVALSYPHLGSWYAYLCNANSADGSFAQFFPIPAGTTAATIQFYLNIVSQETAVFTAYDTMKVDLVTANEQYVGTIAQFSNLDKGANVNGSYVLKSYNIMPLISAYKGQSLFLVFSGHTDADYSTIFRIDDVDITLTVNNPVSLTGLSIRGPSSIPEGRGDTFWADAIFSDGTTQQISPNSWIEDSAVTTISADGFLLAGSVGSDTPVTVTASYTFNGVTQQATKSVTIVDANPPPAFSLLAISGPSSINENNSGQFTATAIFSDGSSQLVSPSWFENSTATSISNGGLLSAGEVSSDTTLTVTASHTIGGVTRNANQDILIVNVPPPRTLVSLSISGSSLVDENSTAPFSATASFSDGTLQVVSPTWSVDSAATSISIFGLLSAGEVASDTAVTISASCSTGGITRTAQKSVTVVNAPTRIISLNGNLAFSNVMAGSSAQRTLTIANNGNSTMTVSSISYPSGFSGNWSSGTIPASGSHDVTVTFSPIAATGYGGTVTVNADQTSGANTIAASGTGIPPTPIQLTEMALSNGGFRFLLNGQVGNLCVIQVSSNLVNWLPLVTNVIPTSGSVLITDSIIGSGMRLYRAVGGNTSVAPTNMALIPAGSFQMGDSLDGDSSALPLHTVYVSAFHMDQYEVTKALWDEVYNWATNHGYVFEYGAQGKAASHPAHLMTWYDGVKWCNARSEKEGRVPAYYISLQQTNVYRSGQTNVQNDWVNWSSGYRLPTEAEWEKASRGGASGHRFPWSDEDTVTHSRANYYSSASYAYDTSPTRGHHPTFNDSVMPYTSSVGYFGPNGYGLYDMVGNVWEWCWDWYSSTYYSSSPGTDPRGSASGSYRVVRGGGWYNYAIHSRTAYRYYDGAPHSRYNGGGFRSVLPSNQ